MPRFESLERRLLLATVTLNASKDNILIEDNPSDQSCGVGNSLFIGRTGGNSGGLHNRSVLAFDLTTAGIPSTATITNVELELSVSKSANISGSIVPEPVTIHRMNVDWGEGTSGSTPCDLRNQLPPATPGDTTWIRRIFPDVPWSSPGGTGDFEATASATTNVLGTGSTPIWSSAGMVTDVQNWLAAPSTNFGWMIVGNEARPQSSARRFLSRHQGAGPRLRVTFEETVNLSLTIAADSISEAAGAGATTATVGRTGDTTDPLTVTLASDDTTEATVPATVTIPAGQASSSPFNIDAIDDAIVDGTQTVTISASGGSGVVAGSDTVDVIDDDPPTLTLQIAADSIAESAGAGATTATVSRNTDATSALVVNLASNDTTEASVQPTVTIAAGQTTSPAFNIDAVDDVIVDGTQTVTLTAGAAGHVTGFDTVDVTDDDVGATVTGHTLNGGSSNRSGLSSLSLQFDQDVTVANAQSLKLWNHTEGTAVDISAATLVGNGGDQLAWGFSSVALSTGRYTAKLPVTEGTLARTHTIQFGLQAGDSTGDGSVTFGDFGDLAANFNAIGGPLHGPGDLNGDGSVNFGDFGILANNFNATLAALELDFGDAPAPFPTLLAGDGARHILGSGLLLGTAVVDSEPDGQPTAAADGDGSDEDGLTLGPLQAGTSTTITVNALIPSTAVLNAWIDFNNDGNWAGAGEQIFVDQPLANGANVLSVDIPPGATPGQAAARFRITSCTGHSFTGLARDGEVEDYLVTLVAARPSRTTGVAPNLAAAAAALGPAAHDSSSALTIRRDPDGGNFTAAPATEVVDMAISQLVESDPRLPVSGPHDESTADDLLDQVFDDESQLLTAGNRSTDAA